MQDENTRKTIWGGGGGGGGGGKTMLKFNEL